ncbi:hypothetical protein JCM19240_1548 [Vibrio maritimus]|uniref:Uncharacterized protein n=1 Tax=Vibrio maritimus TaxID=990268 RepID=A0A090T855_9VIBR|nr:hypothetical protein JCM19240_1548 [Vibrio maritimus]
MNKVSLVAMSLVVALAGCRDNSSNSSDDGGIVTPRNTTFTVFDGYIENARVSICETEALTNCEVIGNTDAFGNIDLPSDKVGFVKAEVIAGVSKDSDKLGFVTQGYTMAGQTDTTTINPFTTIATLHPSITLESLAADIGVDASALSSDYIALADAGTHLLARTVTKQLAKGASAERVVAVAQVAQDKIEELESNAVDLNQVELAITVAENGDINVEDKIFVTDARSFLERNEDGSPLSLYFTSFEALFASEGSSEGFFDDGVYTTVENDHLDYTISQNNLTINDVDGDFSTRFFYVSSDIALSVSNSDYLNEMIIHSTDDLTKSNLSDLDQFTGKTLYLIADDSHDSPFTDAILVKLAFGESTVEVTEIDEGTSRVFDYNLDNGGLRIDFDQGESDLHLFPTISNDDLSVWFDDEKDVYAMLMADQGFAQSIVNDWVGSQTELVGTWVVDRSEQDNENEVLMFTFLSNGQYIHTEYDVERAGGEQSGMEWGNYNADGSTLQTSGIFDQNGDTGITDLWNTDYLKFGFTSEDKLVYYIVDDNGDAVDSISFVKADSNGLVGTWGVKNPEVDDEELLLLTFFADGTYVHNEVYDKSHPDFLDSGTEWGNYSINPQTNRATISIIEDYNNSIGLSDFENGNDGQELYLEVKGDVLTLTVIEYEDEVLFEEEFELQRVN